MKVLFFYIDTQTSSGYTTGLGIASISGYLKKHGISTDLVYYKSDKDLEYALEKIVKFSPDIIGFYSTSSNWKKVEMLSKDIRSRFPGAFQIYGGIHAILAPDTLKAIKSLDAVCVGFGEVPMLDLVKRKNSGKDIVDIPGLWVRGVGKSDDEIFKNPPYFPEGHYDEFLNFDYEIFFRELSRFKDFKKSNYRLEIIFIRGCPFKCSFCCNAKLSQVYNNRIFIPSVEASIKALQDSLRATGMKLVEIHDDTFTLNKEWFREFIKRYADIISIPFICNLRAGTFDEEDVALLKKANIYSAWIGVESGNDYIRNDVMKKAISREKIIEAFNLLRRYDISTVAQNIIGVPNETPSYFLDTVDINAEIEPAGHMLSVFCPYPKTELHELCLQKRWLNNAGGGVERIDPVLDLPGFSKEDIQFYFRNFKYLIRYQYNRKRMPYIYILPLIPLTSWIIAKIMSSKEKIADIIKKAAKRALPARTRCWLRKWQHRLHCRPPVGWVHFGSFHRLSPISRNFGLDRGLPVDRYYIEKFLAEHSADIRGRVLEIGDSSYTRKFGGDKVICSDVLDITADNPQVTIVGNLATGENLPKGAFDCMVITQTFCCIYDARSAIRNCYYALKPGGIMLATFLGISHISRYAMDSYGHYWRFNISSVRRMLEEVFTSENLIVEAYGNVLAATAFLQGLATEELKRDELDYRDQDYDITITARVVKKQG